MRYIIVETFKFVYNEIKNHPGIEYIPVVVNLSELIFNELKNVQDTFFSGAKLKDQYKYMIEDGYVNMSFFNTTYNDDQDVLNKLTLSKVKVCLDNIKDLYGIEDDENK